MAKLISFGRDFFELNKSEEISRQETLQEAELLEKLIPALKMVPVDEDTPPPTQGLIEPQVECCLSQYIKEKINRKFFLVFISFI